MRTRVRSYRPRRRGSANEKRRRPAISRGDNRFVFCLPGGGDYRFSQQRVVNPPLFVLVVRGYRHHRRLRRAVLRHLRNHQTAASACASTRSMRGPARFGNGGRKIRSRLKSGKIGKKQQLELVGIKVC